LAAVERATYWLDEFCAAQDAAELAHRAGCQRNSRICGESSELCKAIFDENSLRGMNSLYIHSRDAIGFGDVFFQ
jgi:hypothetical protein